jgi:hypothetical protein
VSHAPHDKLSLLLPVRVSFAAALLRGMVSAGSTSARISVDNETMGGDPAPNIVKRLCVSYSLDGAAEVTTEATEGTMLILGAGSGIHIIRAFYGIAGRESNVTCT